MALNRALIGSLVYLVMATVDGLSPCLSAIIDPIFTAFLLVALSLSAPPSLFHRIYLLLFAISLIYSACHQSLYSRERLSRRDVRGISKNMRILYSLVVYMNLLSSENMFLWLRYWVY